MIDLSAHELDRRRLLGAGGVSLATLLAACATGVSNSVSRDLKAGGAPIDPARLTDQLLLDIQERSFRFFWETTDEATGLAPDRWPTPSFSSIAAVGFALTAYPIGVQNGWITRDQARTRTLTTLQLFADASQGPDAAGTAGYKGFFYHFLGVTKGNRFARCELSTVDTALLLGGMLFAQSWFDEGHPEEVRIRSLVDRIYGAIDWPWITPRAPFLAMGWLPESGFINADWNIYNEGMLLYMLAIGSPTHPLPPSSWEAVTARFEEAWTDRYGEPHLHFPPLFGHQYSQIWIDFRGIRDKYIATKDIDYFENSRRAVRSQRDYAIRNPGGFKGYGENVWGLTACDGPGDFKATIDGTEHQFFSYSARGPGDRDDGTLAPTAAIASIVFEPDLVRAATQTMHDRYGTDIFGKYGFIDSFNPTMTDTTKPLRHGKVVPGTGWIDVDYLGIDQGPIVAMIENWRTGLIWNTMRRNVHLRRGLDRAGFTGGWLAFGV